jgi:hypothetical protein
MRLLPYVRPYIRELTHTLQLPPAHAEIYGGPHAEWLRDCLEYLPRLQCLIVNGLPFFDHSSLLCLRHTSLRQQSNRPHTFPVFGLRLLDASCCTNATSSGLAEALSHLPCLVSLDLSRTLAAKNEAVLSKLSFLGSLRLLRLQSLRLRDAEFAIVARSIGLRVRSLDVSDNSLTDASARSLLEQCLREEAIGPHTIRGTLPAVEYERNDEDLNTFESENLVGHVHKTLTGGFIGTLAIETARDVGITDLYLSNNEVTIEGISGIIRSRRLHVLDIGILPAVSKQRDPVMGGEATANSELAGVSKLTPVLAAYASTKLKYLRINVGVVTQDAPTESLMSSCADLDGNVDAISSASVHELKALNSPNLTNSLSENIPPPPRTEVTTESHNVKRGEVYAPEAVIIDSRLSPTSPLQMYNNPEILPAQDPSDDTVLLSSLSLSDESGLRPAAKLTTRNKSRHNSTYYVEDRRARLDLRQSHENRLHPNALPNVHTLVLTDVPLFTTDWEVINRLTQYIKDVAEEACIAKRRAEHTYALPPGRSRAIAEREHAYGLFALKRLVLEMAPPRTAPKKISSSWRAHATKSSTEDADSEAFWESAAHDFSFFGEDEHALPDVGPGLVRPMAKTSGPEVAERPVVPWRSLHGPETSAEPLFDVVAEIAKFRKNRKSAYSNLMQMGHINPEVEGHWDGVITVIRRQTKF